MILLQIYWSFLKIGFTSFGGMSMIPLITSEMVAHGWMTAAEVSDIVAIAEMTPGPLGLNSATFAGIRTAGFLGAIVANLAVLTPTLTLALVGAIFFEKFKKSRLMQKLLMGIRPACVGLVLGVMLDLAMTNYMVHDAVHPITIAIGLLDLYLLLKRKWSIPAVIGLSAALGLIFFGFLKF